RRNPGLPLLPPPAGKRRPRTHHPPRGPACNRNTAQLRLGTRIKAKHREREGAGIMLPKMVGAVASAHPSSAPSGHLLPQGEKGAPVAARIFSPNSAEGYPSPL